MLIKLDTGLMYEMATCAKTASQYVEESSAYAYRLVPHDDWICKERDYINEGIEIIRKHQATISEKLLHFSDAVSQVATAFLAAEASLPNLFNEVDACVGQLLSVTGIQSAVLGSQTQQVVDQVKAAAVDFDPLQSYAATTIDAPSQICNFSDIVLGEGEV